MISISLCMIVKNGAETLERCLSSVAGAADEIVVVDTGSTDETREIASRYGARLFEFEWIDDFAAARNYAFELATRDYILWLDADDVLEPEDAARLLELKRTLDPDIDSVTMFYRTGFDEYGNVTVQFRRNRLVKRSRGFRWFGPVHEYLAVAGRIYDSDIAVKHGHRERGSGASDRNLNIYRKRLAAGEMFTPRDLYYFANEWLDHGQYAEAVDYYERFLTTGQGWVEDEISACCKLADCYAKLGDERKELEAALRSFAYDRPRAEGCCRVGCSFLRKGNHESAAYWYETALRLPPPSSDWGFANPAYATWLPHLQLCVCYDRLGQHQLAYAHNETALRYRPNDPRMRYNKTYLEKRLGIGRTEPEEEG